MIYYLAHSTSKSMVPVLMCTRERTGNRDADPLDPAQRIESMIPDMAIKRMTSHFIMTM